MTPEEACSVLGIAPDTPYSDAKQRFRARILPLYPHGSAPAEYRQEFDTLVDAWNTIDQRLSRVPLGIGAVGMAAIYNAAAQLISIDDHPSMLDVQL